MHYGMEMVKTIKQIKVMVKILPVIKYQSSNRLPKFLCVSDTNMKLDLILPW